MNCLVTDENAQGTSSGAVRKTIRVFARDSAFVYAIFESLEGMVSYSTLPDEKPGQDYRDLSLFIPNGFTQEMDQVLEGLRKKFPVLELSS
ncbi:MAG: hypothetical protein AB1540_12985 [Bdellovibrionota bacterium]